MDDEPAIDLSSLVPPDPDDQAKPAIRRFRVRAVFAALAVIFAATGVVALAIAKVEDQRVAAEHVYTLSTTPALLTQWGAVNCSTPTYRVGDVEIILLEVARNRAMQPPDRWNQRNFGPATGWIFHFAVRPAAPFTEREGSSDTARIVPVDPPGTPGFVRGRPGWTWTQAYPSIAWPQTGQVTMQIEDANGEAHQFVVDLDEILCTEDPTNGVYIGPA